MADKLKLAVDNDAEDNRLDKKAIRRLEQRNPNWTVDDLEEEVERIIAEESEQGLAGKHQPPTETESE